MHQAMLEMRGKLNELKQLGENTPANPWDNHGHAEGRNVPTYRRGMQQSWT